MRTIGLTFKKEVKNKETKSKNKEKSVENKKDEKEEVDGKAGE